MNPTSKLRERLLQGGWTLDRESKHRIYKHPNGATFPLPRNVSNKGRELVNYMQQIKQREGKQVDANAVVTPQVAQVLGNTPVTVNHPRSKIVLTWYDWIKDCRKTGKFTQQEMEAYFSLRQGLWCHIEQGKRRLSQQEYEMFLDYFHDCPLPEGLIIPIASEADMSKRKPRIHAVKATSIFEELPPPILQKAEPKPELEIKPEPIMSTSVISVDREASVAKAIKILRSKRLTDEGINQLVHTLESQALSLIASGF